MTSDDLLFEHLPKHSSSSFGRRPSWAAEVNPESSSVTSDEDWEDAVEAQEMSVEEMQTLVDEATTLKSRGNTLFTKQDLDGALEAYLEALKLLPEAAPPQTTPTSGVQELTDEQAKALDEEIRERESESSRPDAMARRSVQRQIGDARKALWSNIGAVYVSKGDDKEAVNACTEALRIDPHYVKALHRRASANERLSTWSSLTSSQQDYEALLRVLPSGSPLLRSTRSSLATLPHRITTQQNKEKDEMINKLKELGDGILGKFGLSTNMFKFEPQDGGGYSMRFER